MVESLEDTRFLYDIANGFMPRVFDPDEEIDSIIYDEEETVTEMYFFLDGFIGVGFSLIPSGVRNKKFYIPKTFHAP